MNKDVSKIVENFLSSLEKKVLDLQLQVENLLEKNKEYDELTKLVEEINESKINFSIKFLNGETKQIVELLERVIPEKERINFYLSQITNYYYLYETNLLNTEVTLDQTAFAEQAFTDLVDEISGYLFSIDVVKNREVIKELRELEEKIVKFGTVFGFVEEGQETVDLEFFTELLEDSRLSEEEKILLLQTVIKNNVASYENKLMLKDTKVIEEFEQNTELAFDELEELQEENVVAKIDQETLNEINKLLRNPETIRRLIKIIETTQDIEITIDGKAFQEDQQETVDEALELAREGMVELLETAQASNPEEALDIFMEANDEELYIAEVAYEEIFGEEEKEDENTNIDEYLDYIQKGIEFYDQYKKLIKDITANEKDSIENYARGLYHNKGNRTIVYKSKNFDGNNKTILKEATYEIGELLGIFKQIELADKLTNDIIIKTGRRISEILESVELAKEYDQTPTKKQETTKKGTVYFLEKGTGKDRTFYEDDIGADNCNKGIGKKYYKDLLFQLEQIENRNHIRIPSIRPNNNKSYPYTAEFGVRLISSNRTSTYYIPVGNDDAIIVGVRFIDTGDDYRKTLEHRVKTHSRRLEELIEKVNSAENKKEAQKYIKEIKNILSQGEKNKGTDEELTTMFTVPKVEITPPKHI